MTNSENDSNSGSFSNKLGNATVTLTSNAITPDTIVIDPSSDSQVFTINTESEFNMEITADAADFPMLNLDITPGTLTIAENGSMWILQDNHETDNIHTYNFSYPDSSGSIPAYNVCIELIRVDEGGGIAMVGTVSMIVPK